MTSSLIATGQDDPLDAAEGGGVYSSVADVVGAARPAFTGERPSGSEFDAAVLGLGLDALGAMSNPLAGLVFEPLVGWLIEHVEIVKEPFDKLAGDPAQIKLNAQTVHNVAQRLAEVADEQQRSVAGLGGWQGEAAEAYRTATQLRVESLRRVGADCDRLAVQIMRNGATVAAVRSTIRDLIAELVGWLLTELALALATAGPSAGASMGVFTAAAMTQIVAASAKVADLMSDLFKELYKAIDLLDELAGDVVGFGTEANKQYTKAERERQNWGTG